MKTVDGYEEHAVYVQEKDRERLGVNEKERRNVQSTLPSPQKMQSTLASLALLKTSKRVKEMLQQ